MGGNSEAIIRPEKLTGVKDVLADIGLVGLNVAYVKGRSTQKGIIVAGSRDTASYSVEMLPKVKLELAASGADTERTIDTIAKESRTGNIGDRKIFVTAVKDAIRVRTGKRGDGAL